ncbi:MAG: tRNA pseudouridine(55) synthase TruB [Gammaproteobacteria bacterium]|nr:tRNA pseudouridine(55) synthase TruB [Gammaproteobacteria bacterium]
MNNCPAEPPTKRSKRARQPRRRVDGLVLLDKPVGLSSNQALQQVKRLYRAAKAGHTGSLDPLASGLLPLCLGQATKVSAFLLDAVKEYEVTIALGVQTATGDAEGEPVKESSLTRIEARVVDAALSAFRGEIQQIPPMYSALKHEGRRLYELARAGQAVPREPRTVIVEELTLLGFDEDRPRLRVRCSKGTYIRTLAEDIAAACGTVGHVAALRRTTVGPFTTEQMVTLAELEQAAAAGLAALDARLRPADEALADWPELELGPQQAYYLMQGNAVNSGPGWQPGRVRLYGKERRFLGIGEVLRDGRVAPKRLFVGAESKPRNGVS